MPSQENILVTKAVIVMRPGPRAHFDSFYLLWAMSSAVVRAQWDRVIFMQTNREDVGKRYLEIEIPVPERGERAMEVSEPFRQYLMSIAEGRTELDAFLRSGSHHFFLGTHLTSE
jgi:type I restriction enzyme M protein